MVLIGPYLAACALLVAAGWAKAWHPDDTARALAPLLRMPPGTARRLVRLAAAGEALVGAWAWLTPRVVPAKARSTATCNRVAGVSGAAKQPQLARPPPRHRA